MVRICIASYQRSETINQKSLKVLMNGGYNATEIDLFVANQEEYEKYKSVVPEGINIIIAVKGLKQVREFIFNYYEQGEKILSLDDDIEMIRKLDEETDKLVPVENLKYLVQKGFEECEKHSLKLWGLYCVQGNPFFMKNAKKISYDYKFIIGNFFGFINDKEMNKLNVTNIDDFERSIRSYQLFGGSVRLNHYAAKTNFKKNSGGAQYDPNRQEKINQDMNILLNTYPDLLFLRKKKDGNMNPVLKDKSKKKK
jgi:hypothetical protein